MNHEEHNVIYISDYKSESYHAADHCVDSLYLLACSTGYKILWLGVSKFLYLGWPPISSVLTKFRVVGIYD